MLNVNLDTTTGIAVIEPVSQLEKEDFINAAKLIDPYIKKNDSLNGIIIHTRLFPGWKSFGALVKHFKFVKNHHECITHVAIATDSSIGDAVEHLVNHFVKAKIKRFQFDEVELAKRWILG